MSGLHVHLWRRDARTLCAACTKGCLLEEPEALAAPFWIEEPEALDAWASQTAIKVLQGAIQRGHNVTTYAEQCHVPESLEGHARVSRIPRS